MDFSSLLSFIPEEYHPITAITLLIVFYGFPKFQDFRGNKRYFDAQIRLLEYKKLLYEIESIKTQSNMGPVSDEGLKELTNQVERSNPCKDVLPMNVRFMSGVGGSLLSYALLSIIYFAFLTEARFEEIGYFFIGAVMLSIVTGGPTVLYRSEKKYKSAIFGAAAGLLIAFLIGLLFPDEPI